MWIKNISSPGVARATHPKILEGEVWLDEHTFFCSFIASLFNKLSQTQEKWYNNSIIIIPKTKEGVHTEDNDRWYEIRPIIGIGECGAS